MMKPSTIEWGAAPQRPEMPLVTRCLLALLLVALSAGVEYLVEGRSGGSPYLYFAPGIAIAVLAFGEAASLLYVVSTTLLATYLFLPPLSAWDRSKWGAALVYALSTSAIVLATGQRQRRIQRCASRLAAESERRLRVDAQAAESVARAELADARFRSSFETAAVGMALVGTQGQWIAVNQTLCDMLGYRKEELMVVPVRDITHPEDRPGNQALVDQLWAGRIPSFTLDKRYLRHDGGLLWARLSVSVVRDPTGAALHSVAVVQDISGIKDAQLALQQREAELSDAQRLARIGNWWLDANTRARRWSPMVYEILGHGSSLPPVGTADLQTFFTADTWPALSSAIAELFQHGDAFACDAKVLQPNGQQIWVTLRGRAERDAQGRVTGVYTGTIQDINERKQAELQVVRLNEELELRVARRTERLAQSNRDLDEFAYVVSHDLKEPLRGLSNYASFLREDYGHLLEGDGVSYLNSMQRLTLRMNALIDGLLTYSRATSGEMQLEQVNLDAVLDNVLEDMKTSLAQRQVRVQRSPLPSLRCNELRLREVFQNLITNGAKYNDGADRRIEIGATDADPAVFFVRDNGIGIAPQYQDQVFRIFRRLHPQNQYGGGTGAGLTITKKIIERHGGRIWLESTPGQGTCFFFTLHGAA